MFDFGQVEHGHHAPMRVPERRRHGQSLFVRGRGIVEIVALRGDQTAGARETHALPGRRLESAQRLRLFECSGGHERVMQQDRIAGAARGRQGLARGFDGARRAQAIAGNIGQRRPQPRARRKPVVAAGGDERLQLRDALVHQAQHEPQAPARNGQRHAALHVAARERPGQRRAHVFELRQ